MSENPYSPSQPPQYPPAAPVNPPAPAPPPAPVAQPAPVPPAGAYPPAAYPAQPGYAPQVSSVPASAVPASAYPAAYPAAVAPTVVRKTSPLTWIFLGLSILLLLVTAGVGASNLVAQDEINKRDTTIANLRGEIEKKETAITAKDKELKQTQAELDDAQVCVDAVLKIKKAQSQTEASNLILDALRTCGVV